MREKKNPPEYHYAWAWTVQYTHKGTVLLDVILLTVKILNKQVYFGYRLIFICNVQKNRKQKLTKVNKFEKEKQYVCMNQFDLFFNSYYLHDLMCASIINDYAVKVDIAVGDETQKKQKSICTRKHFAGSMYCW